MNNKFLNKVCDQIMSETRIIDDKLHTPFHSSFSLPSSFHLFFSLSSLFSFSHTTFISHCKEVYSLNEQEIDYVWEKYKKGLTTLMDKKELIH